MQTIVNWKCVIILSLIVIDVFYLVSYILKASLVNLPERIWNVTKQINLMNINNYWLSVLIKNPPVFNHI